MRGTLTINLAPRLPVNSYAAELFFWVIPRSHSTDSFLYLLSPLELILIAGSFPLLPHLLIVRGETRKTSATSLTVNRSGKFSRDILSAILTQYISQPFRGCQPFNSILL